MKTRSAFFETARSLSPLAVAALLLALLSACTEEKRDTFRFGIASASTTLDPCYATDATSMRLIRLIYRSLVDFDEAAQPVPALAYWQLLSPTHYRFKLGKVGRVFHDGSTLTSQDVAATYRFILDPANASPHRAPLTLIQDIITPDEDTVDFHLTRPDSLFPGYLTIGILPAALRAAAHPFESTPVGSGPFAFHTWPEEGRLVLVRRADGTRFEFILVADPTVRVLKLLRGEIDMLQNDLPPELIAYLSATDEVRVRRIHGSNFTYLGFNLQDHVVGQLAVRRAIAHAIDRQAIIRYVLGGAASVANALLPPDHWAGNAALEGYALDRERSRTLLAGAAGFDAAHPARITYKTSSDPFRVRLATVIQHQLALVGIEVELKTYDWGTFYGDIKAGRFQMYSLSWVGIKTPDIFRNVFHSSAVPPAGANRGRFSSALADRLIAAAEAATDLTIQAAYYRRLHTHLLAQLPYVPLWYEHHVFVGRRDVHGYRLASDGSYDGLEEVYHR
jgi:ABC-type dipeptide transport system, periplasmic component